METNQTTTEENAMTVPKKSKFDRITENDGYKLVPANATARKFCQEYGSSKIRMSEAITLKIGYASINWGAS